MEPRERRKSTFIEEATGQVPSELYPAERRIYCIMEVLQRKITLEEVAIREEVSLGIFLSWYHEFLRAAENAVRQMTPNSPPVDNRQKIEITLSQPSFEHIHLTLHRDHFFSVSEVIEHALLLQRFFIVTKSSRKKDARREFDEQMRRLTEEAKADGTYDTPKFSQKVTDTFLDIFDYDVWVSFFDSNHSSQ